MLTVDTSGVLALLDTRDPDHGHVKAALLKDPGPYLVPAGILGEVGYLVEKLLGPSALDSFLGDMESGAFSLDCGERDLPRIRRLASRYANLRLGLVDSCVIACAERSGGKVLTLDRRDFDVVAREGTIEVLPA